MNIKKRIVLNLFIITAVLFSAVGIKTMDMVHHKDANRPSFITDKYVSLNTGETIAIFERIVQQYIVRWLQC
ncbi:hypothetical protein [Elizabethkingia meningoseptica]|uniref:hypothetical protein n=1 Tax=Elizabethkingia meningoseptica TaxID=238 RepID=UPI0008416569|nr:hypothetical protein [Elizabethkingia meningoseptica]ODM52657.1 hypothetical protein BES09_13570 [Elizabethkingia meningoseptica]OHT27568.1 hypothetical protein BFF93_13575 [Elizabethkingia meningoseptica]OPC09158.1 hypothetical protein BAX93_12575 [Elizabethkingia meningoseptica]